MSARKAVASRLADGPAWARSFGAVKTVVSAMIEDGELGRVKPPRGHGHNMIALTAAGAKRYRLRVDAHLLARSVAELEDALAEGVANGLTITEAARAASISPYQATDLWRRIKDRLGRQAQ